MRMAGMTVQRKNRNTGSIACTIVIFHIVSHLIQRQKYWLRSKGQVHAGVNKGSVLLFDLLIWPFYHTGG